MFKPLNPKRLLMLFESSVFSRDVNDLIMQSNNFQTHYDLHNFVVIRIFPSLNMLRKKICLLEKGKQPTSISVLGFVMCSSSLGCSSRKLASVFYTIDQRKDTHLLSTFERGRTKKPPNPTNPQKTKTPRKSKTV